MFEFLIALLFFVEQDADGNWACLTSDVDDCEVETAQDRAAPLTPEVRERERERRQLRRFRTEAEAREWVSRRRDAAARLLNDGQPARVDEDTWGAWLDEEQIWKSSRAADVLLSAAEALAKSGESKPPASVPVPK